MICIACQEERHASCGPVAHPDIEMTWLDCDCLHDPALMQRNAKVTDLLRRAAERFGADDSAGTIEAIRRVLGILDPPRGKLVDLGARMRPSGFTADWMERKR